MGRKQRQAKQEAAPQHKPETSVASLALQPAGKIVAVAVQTSLRICALGGASPEDPVTHTAQSPMRVVAFDTTGRYFLSAGDEKLVQVWDTESWKIVKTIKSPKKVTAAVFSACSSLIAFADKFGDVLTAGLQSEHDLQAEPIAAPLLGHLCSIVTSLAFSPDGKHIVSTDQDCKVRVSTMPKEPQKGAHSIQSICMGHSVFAKCCAFLCPPDAAQPVLLSGGGDSTIRSWNHLTGQQLDCFTFAPAEVSDSMADAAAPASSPTGVSADGGVPPASALLQSHAAKQDLGDADDTGIDVATAGRSDKKCHDEANGVDSATQSVSDSDPEDLDAEEENGSKRQAARVLEGTGQPAVLSISAAPDGCTVAAAVEGRDYVMMLHCSGSGKLAQQQELQLPGVTLPTQVQFDGQGRLWVVGGPLPGTQDAVCIGVASHRGTGPDRQVDPSADMQFEANVHIAGWL